MEVSDETYEMLNSFNIGYNWKYNQASATFTQETLLTDENLKDLRQIECFNILDNRSQMWYNHLTTEQKQELETWYQAWLDITETKVIPEKPEWLK